MLHLRSALAVFPALRAGKDGQPPLMSALEMVGSDLDNLAGAPNAGATTASGILRCTFSGLIYSIESPAPQCYILRRSVVLAESSGK